MNPETNDIAGLLKQLRDDTTTLVRQEVALAKTELSEKATNLSRHGMMIAGGALLGYAALTPLLFGIGFLLRDLFIGWGFREGTAIFLGMLAVALITGAVSLGIVLNAKEAFSKESLTPDKTVKTLKEDKDWIQNKIS